MSRTSIFKLCLIKSTNKSVRFAIALSLTSTFFIAEVITAHITNSVALSADAYLMLSDIASMAVALAVALKSREPTERSTFGFLRAEIVGTLVNTVLVSSLCLTIMFQSVRRLFKPEQVESLNLLMWISVVGLTISLFNIMVIRLWPVLVKFILKKHTTAEPATTAPPLKSVASGDLPTTRLTTSPAAGLESCKSFSSSRLRLNESSPTRLTLRDPSPTGLTLKEPSPTGLTLKDPSPSKLTLRDQSPTRLTLKDPSPSRLTLRDQSPTRLSPSNSSPMRLSPSPSTESIQVPTVGSSPERVPKVPSSNLNANTYGALLNVVTDMLGSLIVLISSIVTKVFYKGQSNHWTVYVDPTLSILMCIMILPSALQLLKSSALILMEVLPPNVSVKEIISDIMLNVPQVMQMHNIHVWKFIDDRIIATLHVVISAGSNDMSSLNSIKKILAGHGIHLCTIQLEHFDPDSRTGSDVCQPSDIESGGCLLSRCLSRCASESVAHAMNQFATTRQNFIQENVIVIEDCS